MMDTSETYIKMCDCSEIQGQWGYDKAIKPDIHDFVHHCDQKYTFSRQVWLPRQDQIQKVLLSDKGLKWNIPKLVGNFVPFFGSNKNYERFNSMEQLWLAFYMKEKHQKMWDGEKWA